MRLFAVAALLVLCAGVSGADVIVETESGQEFPARVTHPGPVAGQPVALRATGTGLRKKAWRKVYAACFYIRADVDPGADPFASFINGDFEKLLVLRALRDADADQVAGAFREGIRKTLKAGHDDAVDGLLALFDRPFQSGQELSLSYAPGEGLGVYRDGRPVGRVDDPAVIAALWAIWFGEDPVSKDLKQDLAGF